MAQVTAAKLPVSEVEPDHCRPAIDPYRMAWTLAGDQLSFADFQEYPGKISQLQPLEWTGGPWRKIA